MEEKEEKEKPRLGLQRVLTSANRTGSSRVQLGMGLGPIDVASSFHYGAITFEGP